MTQALERERLAASIRNDLSHYTCTEQYYAHMLRCLVYTDGVKHLAERAGAYWLIDAIASHQPAVKRDADLWRFQLWRIERTPQGGGVLTCRQDSNAPVMLTQEIEYTDFPLDSWELFAIPDTKTRVVLMLKSEY